MENLSCSFEKSLDYLVPAQALLPSMCDQNNVHILTLVENVESAGNLNGKQSVIKKLFACEYCLTWYASEKDLQNHIVQKHSTLMLCKEDVDSAKLQCMMCNLSFESNEELDKHVSLHAERIYEKAASNLNETNPGSLFTINSNDDLNLPEQSTIWIANLPASSLENDMPATNVSTSSQDSKRTLSAGAKRLAVKRTLKRELLGDEEFRRRMAESQRRTRAKRREKLGEFAFRQEMALKQRQTRERRRQRILSNDKSFEEMSISSATSSNPTLLMQPCPGIENGNQMEATLDDSMNCHSQNSTCSEKSRSGRLQKKLLLGEKGYRQWMADQQRRTRAKKRERIGESQYKAEMAEKQRRTRAKRKWKSLLVADMKQHEISMPILSACIFSSTRHATGVPCGNRSGALPPDYVKLMDVALNDLLIPNMNNFSPIELRSVNTERALIFNRAGVADTFKDNDVICVWHRYHYGIGFLRSPNCCHPLHVKKESLETSLDQNNSHNFVTRPSEESLALTISSKFNMFYPIGQSICTDCHNIEMSEISGVTKSLEAAASSSVTCVNSEPLNEEQVTTIYVTTSANEPAYYSLSVPGGVESLPAVKQSVQPTSYVSYNYISATGGQDPVQQFTALNSATILATSGGKTFTLPVVYVQIDGSIAKQETVSNENMKVASEDYTSNRLIPLQSQSPSEIVISSSKSIE